MLILDNNSERIRLNLNVAVTTNQLDIFSSFRERTSSSFVARNNFLTSNNTTPVDIVATPPTDTERIIDYISVFNRDTTNKIVTVSLFNGTADYILFSDTLLPNQKLEYNEGSGFVIKDYTSFNSKLQTRILTADVTNNNAVANTIADVTGLGFPVIANRTYYFRFIINYTAAATTTGSRWSINAPASPTLLSYTSRYSLTTTTETINQGLSSYDSPAASNATSASLTANQAIIEGFIRPTSNGTCIARFASEVASSAIIAKAGSIVYFQDLGN